MADLQLDVKGCRDVYASFDKYVEVERLEGDNKYHAEHYGLQVSCYLPVCIFILSISYLTLSRIHATIVNLIKIVEFVECLQW